MTVRGSRSQPAPAQRDPGSASAEHAERSAPGKVNLYVGKTPVKFNIPDVEAVDRLKDLIREHGKWVEPAPQTALEASASPR